MGSRRRRSDEHEDVSAVRPKAKRKRISDEQLAILEPAFEINDTPNFAMREQLASQTGMTNREVQVWAQNRRAKRLRTQQASQSRAPSSSSGEHGPGPSSQVASVSPVASPTQAFSPLPIGPMPLPVQSTSHRPPPIVLPAHFEYLPRSSASPLEADRTVRPSALGLLTGLPDAPIENRPILRPPRTDHLHLHPNSPDFERPAFLPPPGLQEWQPVVPTARGRTPGSGSSTSSSRQLPNVASVLLPPPPDSTGPSINP